MADKMSESESVSNASGGGGRGRPRPSHSDGKLCYTVPEAAALLGFSRNFGYELARRGEIPVIRFGKRMLVPKVPFEKMLGKYKESEVENNERTHL